jgi:single-strand DNA-binding protein
MNETPIQIVGNLTDNPELRFTPSGTAVANLRVATNPRRYDRHSSQWVDGETNYFNVEVWNAPAQNVAESFAKGDRVIVLGTIRTKTWTPDDGGAKRSAIIVVADEIGASTRYATAKPQKVRRDDDVPDSDEPPF